MKNTIETSLANHLRCFSAAPFLFIGSGFSRRYINLETWEELLKIFCEDLPHNFNYYKSSANGELPKVASLMAEDFFDVWWGNEKYKDSRAENEKFATNRSSPLKIEISNYLKNKKYLFGIDEQLDREINALRDIVINGIITTNWDNLLEEDFFQKQISKTYVGQEELIFSNPEEISEIYKIHGSLTNPNSLILTSDDYDDFKKKNPYLAAKLMTIFMEHPIVFIGYSMSDENIIEILQAITSCLNEENLSKLKDRLIFLHRDSKNEGDSFQNSSITIGENTLMITRITTNDFSHVFRAMSNIQRKIPAKILRQIKSQIYELVKTNDPHEKIYATIDLEDNVRSDELEFVFGVGVKEKFSEIGYSSISSDDLFADIISNETTFDYNAIVNQTLPTLLRRDQYIPIFKYCALSDMSYEQIKNISVLNSKLTLTIDNLLSDSEKAQRTRIQKIYSSIAKLETEHSDNKEKLFKEIILLNTENIDITYLQNLIERNLDFLNKEFYTSNIYPSSTRTAFRKLIRYYDILVFKSQFNMS